MPSPQGVRCRPIAPADLPAVADLLGRGFPARPRRYWARGLDRLARRDVPAGYPRFGYLLEAGGVPVGVLLMIVAAVPGDTDAIRCNLSSWYVEPAFRGHAAGLGAMPFRHRGVTFVNSSPAPNTWATIEAQGFRRYATGQMFALPALARGGPDLRVEPFRPGADVPEATLLADHRATGCMALVGRGPDGAHPFVFLPLHARQGRLPLPGVQLVYCASLDALARFARPLGAYLLGRGRPLVVFDAPGPVPGLPGRFWPGHAPKYSRGPHPPRLGDLAYTEFAMFGA